MRGKPLLFIAILGLVAGLALAWDQNGPDHTTLRIGTNPWPGFEYLHLAHEKGFFEQEGVAVKFIRFSALQDTQRAYERGQLDGMGTTLSEALQAEARGHPIRPVLIADFSNGGDRIIARNDIANVKSLKGKKVGVELGMLSEFILARALEKNHLSLNDVELVGLSPLNMQEALLSGQVDAVHAYPPVSLNLLATGKAHSIFDSSEIPGEVVDIVSFDPKIVADYPEDIDALRRAWDKAVAYANANPEDAHAIMARMEGISPEEFTKALAGVKILPIKEQRHLVQSGTLHKAVEGVIRVMKDDEKKPFSLSADEFLEHAQP